MANRLVLMGVDPGVTTGVALKIGDRYLTTTTRERNELWDMIKKYKPDKLAFETFARSGRVDQNMIYTMELVGSIRAVTYVLGIASYGQAPQTRRSYLLDAETILKNSGAKFVEHEKDALAHVLFLEDRMARGKVA